jgi:hypothetical protein
MSYTIPLSPLEQVCYWFFLDLGTAVINNNSSRKVRREEGFVRRLCISSTNSFVPAVQKFVREREKGGREEET